MKRKNAGYVMTTVLLDPKVREEFEKLLPRDKTLADAFREWMSEVVEESKKKEAPEKLPILSMTEQVMRQSTINEYDIKLFESKSDRIKKINMLTKNQKDKVRKDLCQLQKELRIIIN